MHGQCMGNAWAMHGQCMGNASAVLGSPGPAGALPAPGFSVVVTGLAGAP